MPATQPKFKEFPLTYEKGLVTEIEESTLELGQSSVLENWEPTAQGGLRARNRWNALSKTGLPSTYSVRGFGSIATGGSSGAASGVQVVQTSRWPDGANVDPVATKTGTLNGCSIGNVLVAVVTDSSGLTPTIGGTGGWTQRAVSTGNNQFVKFYTKTAAASTETFIYTITSARIRSLTVYELSGVDSEDPGTKWAANFHTSGSGSDSLTVNATDTDGGIAIVGYHYDGGTPATGGSGSSGYVGSTLDDSNSRTGVLIEDLDQLDGNTTGGDWTTPSYTPPATGTLLMVVGGRASTSMSLNSVTGCGLSWTVAAFTGNAAGEGFWYAWANLNAGSSEGTITVDMSASGPQFAHFHFFHIVGGPESGTPVQQSSFGQESSAISDATLAASLQPSAGLLGLANSRVTSSNDFSPQADADDFESTTPLDAGSGLNSSGQTIYYKAARKNSAATTDTSPDWTNNTLNFINMGVLELKGDGGAAQARHGNYTTQGEVTETYSYVNPKAITGKMVVWGHTPTAAVAATVDFYIVMALAIGTTEYELYRILRDEITTGTWTKIDEVTDATDNTAWVSMAQGSGKLVWTATTLLAPRAITLSTMQGTNITDLQNRSGRSAVYHKDRMFIAGENDLPSRVYFSGIGDPTDFVTATDFLDIGGDDGEAIQDAVSVEGLLLLCKTNRLYLVSGSGIETFFVNELPGGSAAAGRCVVRTPYGTIVAGTDDIWVVQGGAVDPMSRPLGAGYRITGSASCAYAQDSVLIADSGTGQVWRANLVTGAWMLEPPSVTATPNRVYTLFSLNGRLYYGTNASTTQVGGTRQLSFDRTYDETSGGTTYRASTGRMSLLGPSYKYSPRFLWLQLRNQDILKPAELLVTIESNLSLLPGFVSEPQSVRVTEDTQRERLDLGRHKGAEWLKISYFAAASATEAPMDIEKSVLGVLSEEYR